SFFKNAPKTYYTKILGVYYNTDTFALSETENFNINHLESFLLKKSIFNMDNNTDTNEFRQKLLLTGQLPLKNVATRYFDDELAQLKPMMDNKQNIVGNASEIIVAIQLSIENFTLNAQIDKVYNRVYVFPCYTKKSTKYMLEAYLNFLLLRATDNADDFYFLHQYIGYQYQRIITKKEALEKLQKAISIFLSGLASPYPLCAEMYDGKTDINGITIEKLASDLEKKINAYE